MNLEMDHAKILSRDESEELAKIGRMIMHKNLEIAVGAAVRRSTLAEDQLEQAQLQLRDLIDSNGKLLKRAQYLERVIRWALGESPGGMPEFRPRGDREGQFYWRNQLAELAGLPQEDEE